ncbi:MAG: hypothetical protein Q8L66_06830 [Caulobacter sp.]|nr:hypothetical protein [Caulobacter sp.]
MTRLPALLLAALIAAAGSVALAAPTAGPDAQPAAYDPIGDAIAAALPPDQTTDMEDEAPAARTARPPVAVRRPTPAPAPALVIPRSRRSDPDRAPMISDPVLGLGGPPSPTDIGYETRIRASVASAQGQQGPLDGGWTVRSAYGVPVLNLQLVDRGSGAGRLEGAWRSLGDPVGRVGLIDSLDRQAGLLTVRITKSPTKPVTLLRLTPLPDGGWTGDITDEWGVHPVTMTRN